MIDTKNIRNVLIGVIAILLLALGAYGAGFYYIKTQVEETSALAQELEQKQAERKNLQQTLRVVEETESERTQLDEYFVRSSNVVAFIERLESLGGDAGVESTISDLREEQNGTLAFSLQAQGSFAGVLHYTDLIEHLPLNLTLDQVQVERAGDSEWEATYTGTVVSFLPSDDT